MNKLIPVGIILVLSLIFCNATCYALAEKEYYGKVMSLLEQNRYGEALGLTNELVKSYPKSVKAKALEIHVLGFKEDLNEAEQKAKAMIAAFPQPATDDEKDAVIMSHTTLSNIYMKQSQVGPALVESELALKIKPSSEVLLWQLAVVYAKLGMYGKAKKKANRLIEIGDKGESGGVMAGYAKELLKKIESATMPK